MFLRRLWYHQVRPFCLTTESEDVRAGDEHSNKDEYRGRWLQTSREKLQDQRAAIYYLEPDGVLIPAQCDTIVKA